MTQKKTAKPTKGMRGSVQEQVVSSGNVQAGAAPIHQIIVVQNRFVYRALQAIVWLAAATVVGGLLTRQSPIVHWPITDVIMYDTGILAAVLALLAFQVLMRRVPLAFASLWKRKIIASRSELLQQAPAPGEATSSPPPTLPPVHHLEAQYQTFLRKLEALLNHPGQWLMGGIIALLVLTWEANAIREIASWTRLMQYQAVIGLVGMFGVLIQFILAFMIGLLIWRMIVVGVYVWRLGKVFDVNPQIGYPDACGGLELMGNLCLWNALIVSIAGVYLGGWIILAQILKVAKTDPLYPWYQQALAYSDLFSSLILVPIAVAVISFFVPLWSIHQAMLVKQSQVKQEMEQLAQTIAETEQTLLEQADTLAPQAAEDMGKKLKMMQEVYERNRQYPVWPFNVKTLAKFASSQIVPLLVALGLSDKVADVIRGVLNWNAGN